MGRIFSPKIKLAALPAPPPVVEAPVAPTVSTAADVSPEPVVDIESTRRRAATRLAKSKETKLLFGLSEASKTSVNLTNKLLGE